MSTDLDVDIANPLADPQANRLYTGAALVGILAAIFAFLSPLYHTVDVLGGTGAFLVGVVVAAGLALMLGRALSNVAAFLVAVIMLAAGLGLYLLAVPADYWEVLTLGRIVGDLLALLTGYSILQMTTAGVWAIGVAPGPVFLTLFFALRGEYVRSGTVASLVLGFFVLTGDAGTLATLFGVIGIAGAVAFHTLDQYGGSRRHAEVLAASLAVMILASTAVSAVPGGGASPIVPNSGPSLQGSLVDASNRQSIQGSIRLSPKVHFVIESEKPAYWRVAVYDRFTGREWVRTGATEPLGTRAEEPPGPRETVFQQVTAKTALAALPAAAKGIRVTGLDGVRITQQGTLLPPSTLGLNETYGVVSSVSTATPAQLRNASTDYPDSLSATYFELPKSTSSRVGNLTANITAQADNPYEAAKAIENWLEANKRYSLNVDRPDGNIAEQFIFDMNEGYCVYYATAMVTMLRSQGIPARYVTGYTTGQQVSADTWVVRGYNSHAWVEVYFPDYGWIRFDPTPAQTRSFEEEQVLEAARERGVSGIEAAGSQNGTYVPPTTAPPSTTTGPNGTTTNGTNTSGLGGVGTGFLTVTQGNPQVRDPADRRTLPSGTEDGSASGAPGWAPRPPAPPETMALWGVLAVGLAAGARRSGAADRVYRTVWLGYHPGGTPQQNIEGAFQRVLYLLEREYRPRRQGETIREYLTAIEAPDTAREVAHLHEQCLHAGRATETDAREARELAAEYVKSHGGAAATLFNRLMA
ncbi:MAG: DUF3488 and DUF4129 domain-containing transglutaminase family protein [Halobacteriaceae archaeon]